MTGDYNMLFEAYILFSVKYRVAYLITQREDYTTRSQRSEFGNILLIRNKDVVLGQARVSFFNRADKYN
jgi:hypothetical protein